MYWEIRYIHSRCLSAFLVFCLLKLFFIIIDLNFIEFYLFTFYFYLVLRVNFCVEFFLSSYLCVACLYTFTFTTVLFVSSWAHQNKFHSATAETAAELWILNLLLLFTSLLFKPALQQSGLTWLNKTRQNKTKTLTTYTQRHTHTHPKKNPKTHGVFSLLFMAVTELL